MEFDGNKLREIRKRKHISVNYIIEKMNIARGTLWTWEKGVRNPGEKNIRKLAELLNISVTVFSDLEESINVSDLSLKEIVNKSLKENQENKSLHLTDTILGMLLELRKKQEQSSVLLNAVFNSTGMMFYIKDSNLRFISVNDRFLKTLSMPDDISYAGKDDSLFFSQSEAFENNREDEKVLMSGNPVINREGILPGTRKKKYALISKYPIMDSESKVTGIIGVFIDITEQRKNKENSELLKIILNNVSSTGITIGDVRTGKYLYINKAKELIYERNKSEFFEKGKTFWLNQCIHPDDRERVKGVVGAAVDVRKKEQSNEFIFKIVTPEGKSKKIDCRTIYVNFKNLDCSLHIETVID